MLAAAMAATDDEDGVMNPPDGSGGVRLGSRWAVQYWEQQNSPDADWDADNRLIRQLVDSGDLTEAQANDMKDELLPLNDGKVRVSARCGLHTIASGHWRAGAAWAPPTAYTSSTDPAKRLPAALIKAIGADSTLLVATWLADP
jgi:hypothetical protein